MKSPGGTSDAVRANVRRIRRERGLSYAELSRRLTGIGHPILDTGLLKIEKGDRRIDIDDLVALAAVLEVSAAGLLGETMCKTCDGKPHAGFTCNECGRSGQ